MRLLIFLMLLSLISCGKVKHEASGSVESKNHIWIAYQKMYEEWVYICKDLYDQESLTFLKCKVDAKDRLTKLLVLDKNI